MSLQSLALAAINDPARPSCPWTMRVARASETLTCAWQALETVGCAFEELNLTTNAWDRADLAELKRISHTLAGRLTYLLEPIQVLEADGQQRLVLLRSQPPQQQPAGTSYYELRVRKDGWLLCRFRKDRSQPQRVRIPCEVTREVFARLVHDLDPDNL